jgi:hypothetical protein
VAARRSLGLPEDFQSIRRASLCLPRDTLAGTKKPSRGIERVALARDSSSRQEDDAIEALL